VSAETELPMGWTWATIGEVTDSEIEQRSPEGEAFTYVEISSINNEAKVITEPTPLPSAEAPSRAKQCLRSGDVLVSMTRPNLNAVALVPDHLDGATASTGFCVIRPLLIAPEWVFYLVQSPRFIEEMSKLVQGVVYPAVRPKDVRAFRIPLAPLSTQRSIILEIDKEFSRLEAAVASLKRVQANLKRYRAAVLKAACEGRLVPTEAELARAERREYEPADQLIRRTQRRPPSLDAVPLPPLPEGWAWASIGDLFVVSVGATPNRQRPEFWDGRISWVSSGEVAFCRIRETRERITEEGLKHTSTECHPPGTVLLAMIGEGKTRGQAALLDVKACNNQNSAAIRVSETEIEPEYVYYFLWSDYERTRRLGSGNNQPALNKSRVQAIPMPIPPLAEQRRIVQELERQLSVLASLHMTAQDSLKRAKVLRELVLRKAFQGRLVPQDFKEEPASVLLERIRQVRTSQSHEARPKKERKKAAPPPFVADTPPVPATEPRPADDPEPEPQEADFLELPRDEQVEIIWEALLGHGMLEKDTAIRTAADVLRDLDLARFKRHRQDGPLYSFIAAAIERGVREGSFDRPRRGSVRAVLPDPKEYTIEDWQRCLFAVTGPEPADIDTTLRAAAEWARETMGLEFARLREDGVILTGLHEALESELREGRVVRRGGRVWRA
jgi:type I restriction enzyme S subunit